MTNLTNLCRFYLNTSITYSSNLIFISLQMTSNIIFGELRNKYIIMLLIQIYQHEKFQMKYGNGILHKYLFLLLVANDFSFNHYIMPSHIANVFYSMCIVIFLWSLIKAAQLCLSHVMTSRPQAYCGKKTLGSNGSNKNDIFHTKQHIIWSRHEYHI